MASDILRLCLGIAERKQLLIHMLYIWELRFKIKKNVGLNL